MRMETTCWSRTRMRTGLTPCSERARSRTHRLCGTAPADIGPGKYPPGQYHNEGIWPWIASYAALAWARVGERNRALSIITALLGPEPTTVHEWVDGITGERHHPDFATGAGALGW